MHCYLQTFSPCCRLLAGCDKQQLLASISRELHSHHTCTAKTGCLLGFFPLCCLQNTTYLFMCRPLCAALKHLNQIAVPVQVSVFHSRTSNTAFFNFYAPTSFIGSSLKYTPVPLYRKSRLEKHLKILSFYSPLLGTQLHFWKTDKCRAEDVCTVRRLKPFFCLDFLSYFSLISKSLDLWRHVSLKWGSLCGRQNYMCFGPWERPAAGHLTLSFLQVDLSYVCCSLSHRIPFTNPFTNTHQKGLHNPRG